jgi:hypothetical protein
MKAGMHRYEGVASARGETRCSVTRAALSRAITARTPQARKRNPLSEYGADTPDASRPKDDRYAEVQTSLHIPTVRLGYDCVTCRVR